MNFRLANINDLPQLKTVYGKIIEDMNGNDIQIWDEIYPCEFFGDDIKENRLYVLEENGAIASAFALLDSNAGADCVTWQDAHAKALYIDRLGVNVDYAGRGIGSMMLRHAAALAKEQGADYLRLFVVDINEPAIKLYIKNGFTQAGGSYDEKIDDDLTLHELGFEIKT